MKRMIAVSSFAVLLAGCASADVQDFMQRISKDNPANAPTASSPAVVETSNPLSFKAVGSSRQCRLSQVPNRSEAVLHGGKDAAGNYKACQKGGTLSTGLGTRAVNAQFQANLCDHKHPINKTDQGDFTTFSCVYVGAQDVPSHIAGIPIHVVK